MDFGLEQHEIDQLIEQLNPQQPQPTVTQDRNWQLLRQESHIRRDPFQQTVKTKTPSVLEFEKHSGFTYRRSDGAHWHTELRNLDPKKTAFTPQQHVLKDLLNTVFALTQSEHKIEWMTPLTKQDEFDPQYQLFKYNNEWYCLIDNCAYAASNSTVPRGKNYRQITFSTREQPVFTIEQLNKILDKLTRTSKC